MKLLLDEMHSPSIADGLCRASHGVTAVAATPELRGTSDADLLAFAAKEGFALVTENVVDFATLANQWAAEARPHAGIIFTNPQRFNRAAIAYPSNLTIALEEFLDNKPIQGESWVWWL